MGDVRCGLAPPNFGEPLWRGEGGNPGLEGVVVVVVVVGRGPYLGAEGCAWNSVPIAGDLFWLGEKEE